MKRNVISIDEDKCIGCGLCVSDCHQGALELLDGKAHLICESTCDGLGLCLLVCQVGALKVMEKVEKNELGVDKCIVEEKMQFCDCSGACSSKI